jgi:glycosyltransferase involved in cell wall biosynthesis
VVNLWPVRTGRPIIVQHVAGQPGHGGPATALGHLLASPLSDKYQLVTMRQTRPARGINPSILTQWVRLLRSVRPDIVHVRGLGNEGFHGVIAAGLAGCPRILLSIHGTVRDLWAPPTARRALVVKGLEPASLRIATHLAAVCRSATQRSYLDGVRHKLVGVVYNGTDLTAVDPEARSARRTEMGIEPDDVAVMIVGRLSMDKGHRTLAQALGALGGQSSRVVLVVVGAGPDRDAIEAAYAASDDVEFRMLGHRQDVRELLSAADIFTLPSLHENLSNALIEAMAAGLPVVATAVGGTVEVLERGGGELVPPDDPRALSAALQRMIVDTEGRRRIGDAGRRIVAEHFSTDQMIAGWDAVYQRILEPQ